MGSDISLCNVCFPSALRSGQLEPGLAPVIKRSSTLAMVAAAKVPQANGRKCPTVAIGSIVPGIFVCDFLLGGELWSTLEENFGVPCIAGIPGDPHGPSTDAGGLRDIEFNH